MFPAKQMAHEDLGKRRGGTSGWRNAIIRLLGTSDHRQTAEEKHRGLKGPVRSLLCTVQMSPFSDTSALASPAGKCWKEASPSSVCHNSLGAAVGGGCLWVAGQGGPGNYLRWRAVNIKPYKAVGWARDQRRIVTGAEEWNLREPRQIRQMLTLNSFSGWPVYHTHIRGLSGTLMNSGYKLQGPGHLTEIGVFMFIHLAIWE